MKLDALYDRLVEKGTGGHPDHFTPDPIFREAADAILLMQDMIEKLVIATNPLKVTPDYLPRLRVEASKLIGRD
jgi:hypothetical protein